MGSWHVITGGTHVSVKMTWRSLLFPLCFNQAIYFFKRKKKQSANVEHKTVSLITSHMSTLICLLTFFQRLNLTWVIYLTYSLNSLKFYTLKWVYSSHIPSCNTHFTIFHQDWSAFLSIDTKQITKHFQRTKGQKLLKIANAARAWASLSKPVKLCSLYNI